MIYQYSIKAYSDITKTNTNIIGITISINHDSYQYFKEDRKG